MGEALDPGGGAVPLGPADAATGVGLTAKQTMRKRVRSVGDEPISPENRNQLLDERKKTKAGETYSKESNPSCEESNKSPEENCVSCAKIGLAVSMIKCQLCDDFYHIDCCGIPKTKQKQALEMISLFGWSCKECRIDHRQTMIRMKQEISSLQQQLDMLLARSQAAAEGATEGVTIAGAVSGHTAPTTIGQETNNKTVISYSDVVKAVGKAVDDCSRRKRNVIITGLSEKSEEDIVTVTNLFGSVLRMDIQHKIVMMKRLGKLDSANVPTSRRLLVTLDSESTAAELLNRSLLLKEIQDQETSARIYINIDLSPEESKAAYERRQQRRQQQNNGSAANDHDRREFERGSKVYYRSTANKPGQRNTSYQPSFVSYKGGVSWGGGS
jgi:hypothetical protein